MGFKTQQIVLKMDTHGLKSGSKELWPFEKKITSSLGSKYASKNVPKFKQNFSKDISKAIFEF